MIRLKGLIMIINCLMPILLAAGLTLFFVALWNVVRTELQPPVEQLVSDAGKLADHAREAARSVEATAGIVREEVGKVQDAAANMVEPLTSFSIDIPRVDVPVFRVRGCRPNLRVRDALNLGSCFGDFNVLGGLSRTINSGLAKAFKGPREEFQKISGSIQRARDEINKLAPLGDAFRAQAAQFEKRAEQLALARERIAERTGRVLTIAGWTLAVFALWPLVSYLLWIHERLAVGWYMVQHGVRP